MILSSFDLMFLYGAKTHLPNRQKSWDTLHFLYSAMNCHPSPPRKQCLLVGEVNAISGKISNTRKLQVSHRRTNIIVGGRGACMLEWLQNVEECGLYHFPVCVPRTFAEYSSSARFLCDKIR